MPVDHTKASSSTTTRTRVSRKINEEELKDIELKRLRGEISCAECRRLKLRCDKKVPCGSCCRRGCESICPCGVLSAGQGTRFILADTEQLHRKIADMSHRIRQLEDALAILQSTVSDQRHPLLEDALLKIKFGAEALSSSPAPTTENTPEAEIQSIDALGTLTLGDAGEMKYFGRSAGSETLLLTGEEWDAPSSEEGGGGTRTPLTPELENLANLFPFTTRDRINVHAALDILHSFLPSHDRAWSLAKSYIDHGTLFFRPIKRDELLNSVIPEVYHTPITSSSERSQEREFSLTPHTLATIFFIFALGALLDLNLPPYNSEAERYYDLGRAALSLRPVFDSPEVSTVQAVGLMATYHSLAGKRYSRDSAWCIMSVAAKLAQSIGLHRDSTRWNMDPITVQKRRTLFWEIFAADVSHSLALGRPPSIHLSYVDCEFPTDEEGTLSETGESVYGFWRMKHTFAKDIFLAVLETTLSAKSPSYSTILDIDKKVREMAFPASFKPYARLEDGEDEYYSSSSSVRGFYSSQHRTITMLYLHRSFFAQAMLDHPKNPLLSPFAPSFLTAYRCASVIIKATAHQFDRCAEMAKRLWFLLYHTFSAAVIVGSVVTRSPNSSMASSALLDLGLAVEIFQRSAPQSRRARIALNVLTKLKDKADRAFSQLHSPTLPLQAGTSSADPFPMSPPVEDSSEDELAIFGGQTKVLSRRLRTKGSPRSSSDSSCPASPPSTQAQSHEQPPVIRVHPSLVDYLNAHSTFPEFQTQIDPYFNTQSFMGTQSPSSVNFVAHPVHQDGYSHASLTNPVYPGQGGAGPSFIPNLQHTGAGLPNRMPTASTSSTNAGWNNEALNRDWTAYQAQVPPSSNISSSSMAHRLPTSPVIPIPATYYPQQTPFETRGVNQQQPQPSNPDFMVDAEQFVDLGLSSESWMDEGWLAFMRQSGILEGRPTSFTDQN